MLITTGCYCVALGSRTGRRLLGELWHALMRVWWMPVAFACTSFLVASQMWLFSWAPAHGHALDASLGYLLLPIVLVLVGRIGFKETVSGMQWLAVAMAVAAVGLKVVATAAVSWVTFAVCFGYALYFALRRRFGLDSTAAFGAEVALTVPVAVLLIVVCQGSSSWGGHAAVLFAGLAGALAMSAYVAASTMLSMPVFGLLTYVEPVLMFIVALLLGERLTALDAVVYTLLAVALTVLAIAGFRSAGRARIAGQRARGAVPDVPM